MINGDIIRENTGPIAIDSRFGWMISGPVKATVSQISVTRLILDTPESPEVVKIPFFQN